MLGFVFVFFFVVVLCNKHVPAPVRAPPAEKFIEFTEVLCFKTHMGVMFSYKGRTRLGV
jgi:hypothetical protein